MNLITVLLVVLVGCILLAAGVLVYSVWTLWRDHEVQQAAERRRAQERSLRVASQTPPAQWPIPPGPKGFGRNGGPHAA